VVVVHALRHNYLGTYLVEGHEGVRQRVVVVEAVGAGTSFSRAGGGSPPFGAAAARHAAALSPFDQFDGLHSGQGPAHVLFDRFEAPSGADVRIISLHMFVRIRTFIVREFYLDGFFHVVSVFILVRDGALCAWIRVRERPCGIL